MHAMNKLAACVVMQGQPDGAKIAVGISPNVLGGRTKLRWDASWTSSRVIFNSLSERYL